MLLQDDIDQLKLVLENGGLQRTYTRAQIEAMEKDGTLIRKYR